MNAGKWLSGTSAPLHLRPGRGSLGGDERSGGSAKRRSLVEVKGKRVPPAAWGERRKGLSDRPEEGSNGRANQRRYYFFLVIVCNFIFLATASPFPLFCTQAVATPRLLRLGISGAYLLFPFSRPPLPRPPPPAPSPESLPSPLVILAACKCSLPRPESQSLCERRTSRNLSWKGPRPSQCLELGLLLTLGGRLDPSLGRPATDGRRDAAEKRKREPGSLIPLLLYPARVGRDYSFRSFHTESCRAESPSSETPSRAVSGPGLRMSGSAGPARPGPARRPGPPTLFLLLSGALAQRHRHCQFSPVARLTSNRSRSLGKSRGWGRGQTWAASFFEFSCAACCKWHWKNSRVILAGLVPTVSWVLSAIYSGRPIQHALHLPGK